MARSRAFVHDGARWRDVADALTLNREVPWERCERLATPADRRRHLPRERGPRRVRAVVGSRAAAARADGRERRGRRGAVSRRTVARPYVRRHRPARDLGAQLSGAGPVRVSHDGGTEPVWSSDGCPAGSRAHPARQPASRAATLGRSAPGLALALSSRPSPNLITSCQAPRQSARRIRSSLKAVHPRRSGPGRTTARSRPGPRRRPSSKRVPACRQWETFPAAGVAGRSQQDVTLKAKGGDADDTAGADPR